MRGPAASVDCERKQRLHDIKGELRRLEKSRTTSGSTSGYMVRTVHPVQLDDVNCRARVGRCDGTQDGMIGTIQTRNQQMDEVEEVSY
jgi:hypothetical protein